MSNATHTRMIQLTAGLAVLGLASALIGATHAAPLPGKGVPVTPPSVPPGPPETKPTFSYKPDKGFFDDAIAVHPTAGMLAVIHTDSASFVNLQLIDMQTGKVASSFPLGGAQQIYERLIFGGTDLSVLVITRDAATGKRSVQRYGQDGKPLGHAGPAADFGVSERGDKRYLIAWDRLTGKKGETMFAVATHDLATLTRVGKSVGLTLDNDNMIRQPRLKLLGWVDGYSQLIGQVPGGYDKAGDIRMPDRAARYDLLRGAIVWNEEIKDVRGWAQVSGMRARDENRWAFIEPTEDMERLVVIDGMGYRAPATLPVPFDIYDPRSLIYQERPAASRIHFSVEVDPLNPRALLRRKADQPKLDVYGMKVPNPGDLASGAEVAATHLIRTSLDDRPVQWATEGGWLALLRKFKAFSRGGDRIEIYRLP